MMAVLIIIAVGVWLQIVLVLLVIARVGAAVANARNGLTQWQEQQQAAAGGATSDG